VSLRHGQAKKGRQSTNKGRNKQTQEFLQKPARAFGPHAQNMAHAPRRVSRHASAVRLAIIWF